MAVLRRIPEEVSRLSFLISSARANTGVRMHRPERTSVRMHYVCTWCVCVYMRWYLLHHDILYGRASTLDVDAIISR